MLIQYVRDSSFFGRKSSNYSLPHSDSKLTTFTLNSYHSVFSVWIEETRGKGPQTRSRVKQGYRLTPSPADWEPAGPNTLKQALGASGNTRPQSRSSLCPPSFASKSAAQKKSSSCKRSDCLKRKSSDDSKYLQSTPFCPHQKNTALRAAPCRQATTSNLSLTFLRLPGIATTLPLSLKMHWTGQEILNKKVQTDKNNQNTVKRSLIHL